MSEPVLEPARLADLRSRAASRLAGGAADKGPPARIMDALAALYALASSPVTAGDALALLHELQVHQVELELQAQELQESRSEMETALRQQVELYDAQPVGCFTVDARLAVLAMNRTGARMLGVETGHEPGTSLGTFFSAVEKKALEDLVARVGTSGGRASRTLQLRPGDDRGRSVQVHVGGEGAAGRFFIVLADRHDETGLEAGER